MGLWHIEKSRSVDGGRSFKGIWRGDLERGNRVLAFPAAAVDFAGSSKDKDIPIRRP